MRLQCVRSVGPIQLWTKQTHWLTKCIKCLPWTTSGFVFVWNCRLLTHSCGYRMVNWWHNDSLLQDCMFTVLFVCLFFTPPSVSCVSILCAWWMGWCWGWRLEDTGGAGLGWELKATLTPTAGRHAALAQVFRRDGHPLGMDLLHALPVNDKTQFINCSTFSYIFIYLFLFTTVRN